MCRLKFILKYILKVHEIHGVPEKFKRERVTLILIVKQPSPTLNFWRGKYIKRFQLLSN